MAIPKNCWLKASMLLLFLGASCQSMRTGTSLDAPNGPQDPSTERRLRVLAYNVLYVFDHGREVEDALAGEVVFGASHGEPASVLASECEPGSRWNGKRR